MVLQRHAVLLFLFSFCMLFLPTLSFQQHQQLHQYHTCKTKNTISIKQLSKNVDRTTINTKKTICFSSTSTHKDNDDDEDLLPLLNRIIPGVVSYKTIDTIVQANAEGRKVKVYYEQPGSGDVTSKELLIKRVDASKYHHDTKPWADLRRTLLYARTETRFYQEIASLVDPNNNYGDNAAMTSNFLTPKCYLAEYNLQGLMDENVHVLDKSLTDIPPLLQKGGDGSVNESLKHRGATIVLESLCAQHYIQDSPLTFHQAKQSLQALAKLHACTWEQTTLLRKAEKRLSKTVYHLPLRNPTELLGMEDSWTNFQKEFQHSSLNNNNGDQASSLLDRPNIQKLGARMVDMAEYIANELSPRATDRHVCICHGDYKAMNVFLPRRADNASTAIMIDFASSGVGYGMCDVAMHIIHALHPTTLCNGQEKELIDYYLKELHDQRKVYQQEQQSDDDVHNDYPRNVALRHYQLATIDYFRFVLGRFWKDATPSKFEQRKNSKNTVLVNRNIDAAFALIEKVDNYLHIFEEERKEKEDNFST